MNITTDMKSLWLVDGTDGETVYTARSDAREDKRTRKQNGDVTAQLYRLPIRFGKRVVAR